MTRWLEGRGALLLALLAGLLSALAFAPLDLWPLMPLSLALLIELVSRAPSLKRALLLGWLYGVGQFLLGLNWIAVAWGYQAAMPGWMGWLAVFLLSLYLAIYPALASGVGWRLGRKNLLLLIIALAGAWPLTEYLRGTMLSGFAWDPVGAALVVTPWLDSAFLIGTYGLSILTVLLGGAVLLVARKIFLSGFVLVALVGAMALLPGASIPQQIEAAPGQRITIVQPNIGQDEKWRAGFDDQAARILDELTSSAPDVRKRLVFWPEAAVVRPLEDERLLAAPAVQFQRNRAVRSLGPNDLLLTGGIALQSEDQMSVDAATNSIFLFDANTAKLARYDKSHLLPLGEYVPFRAILEPLGLARLAPGAFDFSAGPGPRTIDVPGWAKAGMLVCYEVVFPGKVVDPSDRPDFIFNPSNDAWFGSWGPPQHLAQSRLRAAEEGLPIIRATPTGISALIDARGEVLERIEWKQAGIIDAMLPPPAARTPFARYGNLIPLLIGLALLLIAVLSPVALSRRDS